MKYLKTFKLITRKPIFTALVLVEAFLNLSINEKDDRNFGM